jgi:glycosyltransferase involved in cell wall biosynthesis
VEAPRSLSCLRQKHWSSRMRSSGMRVLHIVPAVFGPKGVVGGAERYAYELARHMARRVKTSLVAFGTEQAEYASGDLRVRTIGSFWACRGQKTNPFSMQLLPEILRADVIHCHQQHVVASSAAAVIARAAGRRVFVSDLGGGGWDVSAYVSTDRWFHAHLHISEYSRNVFGHGHQSWAHVIYGGVDTEKFSPDPSVDKDGSILFVGRLLPHKGVDDLILGLPDGVRLEVIGKPYHSDFLARLHRIAEGRNVHFRHACSDDELVNAYRRASCVVLPSVYRNCYGESSAVPELLGQALLEGMACGTPAICTAVASMPEIVADGQSGFVVPPNSPDTLRERLTWIVQHPDQARVMGSTGRRTVLDRFNWSAVVQRCLTIYTA